MGGLGGGAGRRDRSFFIRDAVIPVTSAAYCLASAGGLD